MEICLSFYEVDMFDPAVTDVAWLVNLLCGKCTPTPYICIERCTPVCGYTQGICGKVHTDSIHMYRKVYICVQVHTRYLWKSAH